MPGVKQVFEKSQLESDVMDTSEDELFINIPMPQVTDISVFLLMCAHDFRNQCMIDVI